MAPRKKIANNGIRGRLSTVNSPDDDSMDIDQCLVKLEASDGRQFTLSHSEARCSHTLRTILDNSPNSTPDMIHLKLVDCEMLRLIVDWCRAHSTDSDIDQDVRSNCYQSSYIQLNQWEKDFFKSVNEDDLFRLIHVSNFLDVRRLFNTSCQTIAKRWEGKKVEDIRKQYGLENDFSSEEELAMQQLTKRLGLNE